MILLAVSFWICIVVVVLPYIVYPLFLAVAARLHRRPVELGLSEPQMTLIITAYNEAQVMPQKLRNTLELDYPKDRLQVIATSDGSTDGTGDTIRSWEGAGITANILPDRRGKMEAILSALPLVTGEIIVFSDATAIYDRGALRAFARNFADPAVGGVSGTLRLTGGDDASLKAGEGAYWRYETSLRRLESATGSTIIAPGSIYAVRRELFRPPPPDTVADDFAVTLSVIEQGYRMVWEEGAVATERVSMTLSEEYERKVRIVAGGIQTLVRFRHLMVPGRGLVAIELISHKLLRWLVPFAMVGALLTNLAIARSGPGYAIAAATQLLFYAIAGAGYVLEELRVTSRIPALAFHFCAINMAAVAGWYRQSTHSQSVKWARPGK